MIKQIVNHNKQQPQQQGGTGTGPLVTEVDEADGAGQDFRNGQTPHTRPPYGGMLAVVPETPQILVNMEIVQTQF